MKPGKVILLGIALLLLVGYVVPGTPVIPLPWRISAGTQGWKKMFFLYPSALFTGA